MNGVNSGDAVNPDDFVDDMASTLDQLEPVPDDVLHELVVRDGSCMVLYRLDLEPEWTRDELTDRETAARICAGCLVRRECLEFELRTSGDQTLGVWGALPAEDVWELYPVWRSRRRRRSGQLDGDPGRESGAGGGRA
jgi:WhiB family redox-sensing transcriptional regulator